MPARSPCRMGPRIERWGGKSSERSLFAQLRYGWSPVTSGAIFTIETKRPRSRRPHALSPAGLSDESGTIVTAAKRGLKPMRRTSDRPEPTVQQRQGYDACRAQSPACLGNGAAPYA
jgi:hypothetical protein